jgi:Na+/melibiose symporter-like transporter
VTSTQHERANLLVASPFSRLAVTHALSLMGDAFVTMALAGSLFFSISPSQARGRVALSLILTVAPFGLVAPFLGPAIDRRPGGRRSMVVLVAAARAVTCLYMAAVVDRLLLFPAAFVFLVLSKTHAVTKSALVPTVVDHDDELVQANSRLSLTGAAVGLVAAIPGIPVLKLAGAEWVLRMAAVAFVVTAIAALRITRAREETTEKAVHVFGRSKSDDDDEGLRARGIRAAAVAMGGVRATVGFLTFLIAFGLRRAGAPAWLFGLALAASMAGTVVGAAAAPALRRRFPEERLLAGCLALVAIAGLLSTRIHGRTGAVVLAAAVGIGASAGKLAFDSLVQRDAHTAVRGRQFARFEAAFQLTWVVGSLIPVLIHIPIRLGAGLLGIAGTTLCALYLAGTRPR